MLTKFNTKLLNSTFRIIFFIMGINFDSFRIVRSFFQRYKRGTEFLNSHNNTNEIFLPLTNYFRTITRILILMHSRDYIFTLRLCNEWRISNAMILFNVAQWFQSQKKWQSKEQVGFQNDVLTIRRGGHTFKKLEFLTTLLQYKVR